MISKQAAQIQVNFASWSRSLAMGTDVEHGVDPHVTTVHRLGRSEVERFAGCGKGRSGMERQGAARCRFTTVGGRARQGR